MSFCNQEGSKIDILEVNRLGWNRELRALPYSWRKGTQATLGQRAQFEDRLKHMKETLLFLECIYEKWHYLSRDKRVIRWHFPPVSLSIGTDT